MMASVVAAAKQTARPIPLCVSVADGTGLPVMWATLILPLCKSDVWAEWSVRTEDGHGVECSHQSCVLWGLWRGQRCGWRNEACGVRTGARLTPLEWVGGHLGSERDVYFVFFICGYVVRHCA